MGFPERRYFPVSSARPERKEDEAKTKTQNVTPMEATDDYVIM